MDEVVFYVTYYCQLFFYSKNFMVGCGIIKNLKFCFTFSPRNLTLYH